MHRLTTALGMPQHRFASIHVVGTNGKSSVTRMTAALLEAHGVGSGACLSPHTARWAERTLIHGEQIGENEWAGAVERVAQAAAGVNRSLDEGDAVTQFEAATAATFVALAAARVEAAVIEAGLGGRLDATNTIPSRVTVLTSIGLDHTDWLGETEPEIAAEKLAVLRDQTTLVVGRVSPAVEALAERAAAAHGARLVRAPEDPGAELHLLAPGGFQRRNFALARAAAEAFLGDLDPELVATVAATVPVPGRLERIAEHPPTYVDAAHNPDGAAALAEALPARHRRAPCRRLPGDPRRQGRRGDDRGAGAGPGPGRLHGAAGRGAGGPRTAGSGVAGRRRACRRLRGGGPAGRGRAELRGGTAPRLRARRRAPRGGSPHSRLPLRHRAGARPALSRNLCEDSGMDRGAGSQLLSMMGLVAAVVAVVILVFFGVGYLFGRLFL